MEAENFTQKHLPLLDMRAICKTSASLCHTSDHPLSLSAQSMQPFENTAPVEHWKWSFLETDSDPTSWIVCHPSYSPVEIDHFGLEFHCFQGKYLGVVWWRFEILQFSLWVQHQCHVAKTWKCQTETKVDYGPNDPTDIMMGLLFIRFPNGAFQLKVLAIIIPKSHQMPKWLPKWDLHLHLGHWGLRILRRGCSSMRWQAAGNHHPFLLEILSQPEKTKGWPAVPRISQPPVVVQAGVLVANE